MDETVREKDIDELFEIFNVKTTADQVKFVFLILKI